MKRIEISSGEVIYYDKQDEELVKSGRLSVNNRGRVILTRSKNGKLEYVQLSRAIMRAGPDDLIEHRDRSPFNNCRANLRNSDPVINAFNSEPLDGFRGVTATDKGRIMVRFSVLRKTVQFGSFDNERVAGIAYDWCVRFIFDEEVYYNFSDSVKEYPEIDKLLRNNEKLIARLNLLKDTYRNHKAIKSDYRGVDYNNGKWRVRVRTGKNVQKHIGLYPDEISAARAYDTSAIEYQNNPVLNFPEEHLKKAS